MKTALPLSGQAAVLYNGDFVALHHLLMPITQLMAAPRLIKKYPNRRLYDTQHSAYITLADVKGLVMAGTSFSVADAKTGEDLTRSVLLQIITEEEAVDARGALLTAEALTAVISAYGTSAQPLLRDFLEVQVRAFREMHDRFETHVQAMYGHSAEARAPELWRQFLSMQAPAMQTMLTAYVEQSQKLFEQLQAQSRQLIGTLNVATVSAEVEAPRTLKTD